MATQLYILSILTLVVLTTVLVGTEADNIGSTGSACTPGQGDKLQNCYLYGKQACTGQYVQWAKDNCAEFCGFCVKGSTTPAPCEDKIPNCKAYGADYICTGAFTSWAEYNCRKFCGFCGCRDLLPKKECYDLKALCSVKNYIEKNCPKTCGLCSNRRRREGSLAIPSCPRKCPHRNLLDRPVCGSDGAIYSSNCMFRRKQCDGNPDLKLCNDWTCCKLPGPLMK